MKVICGPLTEDVVAPLYTAVGHLVVNWALIEQAIDMWCTLAYQSPGGGQVAKDLPRELSRKIRFLKDCLRQMPVLAPIAAEARQYLAGVKRISSARHFVIHGAIAGYDPGTHALRFVRLDLVDERTMHQQKELVISAKQLLDYGVECIDLAPKMQRITKRLIEVTCDKPPAAAVNDVDDDDDRTTEMGLFNFAHSYWRSAVALQEAHVKATHPDDPICFLYMHAVELYLKAFLRAQGVSVQDLRDKYGHRLRRLAEAARSDGLQFDDEDTEVVGLIDDLDVTTVRYIRTGAFKRPALEALRRTCKSLHDSLEAVLRERGLPVRRFE